MIKKATTLALLSTLIVGCNPQKGTDAQTTSELEPTLDLRHAKTIPGAAPIVPVTTCPYDSCVRTAASFDQETSDKVKALALPTISTTISRDFRRTKMQLKSSYPYTSPGIDKRIIQKITRQHMKELVQCAEKQFTFEELQALDNATFALNYSIKPNGEVSDASFKSENPILKTSPISNCITDGVSHWRFPAQTNSHETVKVDYPFTIQSPKDRDEQLPLTFSRYNVDAKITGHYATVTTEFTVTNPNDVDYIGDLNFPLPENAVVTGYAIDVGITMAEATVVEKEQATQAFNQEARSRVDPGLLEQTGENSYRTKIFPILSFDKRHIRVEYTVPLTVTNAGESLLILPMPKDEQTTGSPLPTKAMLEQSLAAHKDIEYKAPVFSLKVEAQNTTFPQVTGLDNDAFKAENGVYTLKTQTLNSLTGENVVITLPKMPNVSTTIEKTQNEYFFAIDIEDLGVPKSNELKPLPKSWRILWDASGSRIKEVYDVQDARPNWWSMPSVPLEETGIAKAKAFIRSLPHDASYTLYVFRNDLEPQKTFPLRDALLEELETIDYDGSTDFKQLAEIINQDFDGETLVFTDGIETVNKAFPKYKAFTTILSGQISDEPLMTELAVGNVIDLNKVEGQAALEALQSVEPHVASLSGKGIDEVQGIGQGTSKHVRLLGRMKEPTDKALLTLSDGTQYQINFDTTKVSEGRVLSKLWAKQRANALSVHPSQNRKELIDIGQRYNIVSPVTSMIVFESYEQWRKYGIKPPTTSKLYNDWVQDHNKSIERNHQLWMDEITNIWDERVRWWNENEKASDGNAVPNDQTDSNKSGNQESTEASTKAAIQKDEEFDVFGSGGYGGNSDPETGNFGSGPIRSANFGIDTHAQQGNSFQFFVSRLGWPTNANYLNAINAQPKDKYYAEYLRQRQAYAYYPTFYTDCATFFLEHDDKEHALRVLSNLAELSHYSPVYPRALALYLREIGLLDESIEQFRELTKRVPENIVFLRDLAITLTMRAKKNVSSKDAQEALELYQKVAYTDWGNEEDSFIRRQNAFTAVAALEEFNELVAWCERQEWSEPPVIPIIDEKFRKLLDTDLRIDITWGDCHNNAVPIVEPSKEDISYTAKDIAFSHKPSETGAVLNSNVDTCYGRAEYLHRHAPKGTYEISLTDPAVPVDASATIYTNWGRTTQQSQTITTQRTDSKNKSVIGTFEVK